MVLQVCSIIGVEYSVKPKAENVTRMVTCNHVFDYVKQTKSRNTRNIKPVYLSCTVKKKTFRIIISILASSPSILKILKSRKSVIVEGHYIYQFWLSDMALLEMWRKRKRSVDGAELAYVTVAGS